MSGRPRRTALAAVGLLVGAWSLTGCAVGAEPAAAPSPVPSTGPSVTGPSVTGPSVTAPSTAAPSTAPAPTPAGPRVLAATYAGGTVSGVRPREAASVGEALTIRVTSDVAEQVHLHGYDLSVDVAAGGTGLLSFTATLPGTYEVELEGSGRLLFQLRVT